MQSTDAGCCYRCLDTAHVVCVLVTAVSPAKSAELTEMLFGLLTRDCTHTVYLFMTCVCTCTAHVIVCSPCLFIFPISIHICVLLFV